MAGDLVRGSGAFRTLVRELRSGLGHAYLLLTPDREAAHRLFLLFAKEAVRASGGVGERQLDENAHPDVKFYPDSGKMNVKEIAELVDDAYVKAIEGGRKFYFLENADGMHPAVQNKLLKTYEEPPEGVTILIGAASESALLPTIRSRAKKLYLEAFSEQEIAEELTEQGLDENSAREIALDAAGNLTDALRFAADRKFAERYRETKALLLNLRKSSDVAEYVDSELFLKENLASTLDFIERILWDAERFALTGKAEGLKIGEAEDLKEIGAAFSPTAAAVATYKLNEARKKLALNISSTTAERLLFDILEAKYQWQ